MAYIINRFAGDQLVSVEDGTLDQTTSLKLVGKNYAGYGESQNENFLHLLESFASTTAPTKAISGQVWFDVSSNKLRFYTGSVWKSAGGAEVSPTSPPNLNEGDFWFNNDTNQLYAKTNDGSFVLVGPQSAGSGTTQMQSINLYDTGNVQRPVIVALVNDAPIYIISETEFSLRASQDATAPNLTGFDIVKKGITLVNTTESTDGVTIDAGEANAPIFWGSASNALALEGTPASAFIRPVGGIVSFKDDAITSVQYKDSGFRVGDSNDMHYFVSGSTGTISNTVGEQIVFRAKPSSGTNDEILKIYNGDTIKGLIPATDNIATLGTSSNKFSTVYATNFSGNSSSATAVLDESGTARAGRVTGSAMELYNTTAIRDSSGNIKAVEFNGIALKARYADLAEKYTTSEELPVGTAVQVAASEAFEVKPASAGAMCIGVISENPAIKMNSEAEGQYVALKGRVPVRIEGAVKKGDAVYAMKNGVCTTLAATALVGVALESNSDEGEKLVECVLKV